MIGQIIIALVLLGSGFQMGRLLTTWRWQDQVHAQEDANYARGLQRGREERRELTGEAFAKGLMLGIHSPRLVGAVKRAFQYAEPGQAVFPKGVPIFPLQLEDAGKVPALQGEGGEA
jgi:hypothetical protein